MNRTQKLSWLSALLGLALAVAVLPTRTSAQDYRPPQEQDQQDDPPSRVARLGYMDGSVSFEPAGESDWVQAADNRPLTTGDKLWADKDSRAELQLGSAVIRLSANTGVTFLNLDDRTVQLQLSAGTVNIRVRRLDRDDVFEIDTPNLAFTVSQPGNYRLEATEDGSDTLVTVREGDGQATGNGQTYTIHGGQRVTFSGTDSLNADMEQIGAPDQFDTWADGRERRHDNSRSAQYLSHDVVGYDDLDDYGDWRDDPNYGHVWYPNRVDAGWAPYHEGHWDWIDPWGYTWVDDSPWGYAPFHYGRWVNVGGRWGWIAGPPAERPVYAPALVVFVGGGGGANVGWFPLGPREVYVPSYPVSREYVNRVNISSTTVNTTTVTNVYNTTIINKTTNITNVTYVNRNVQGAVTAVPQRSFASAQPVARNVVKMDAHEIASAPVSARVAVAPTHEAVLGAHAASANHVTAPPAAVANRQVIAKATPPPPPVSFAKQQQAMAAHPGQPLPKRELATLRPANTPAAQPMVKVAPPGKPATATTGHPAPQPASQPTAARPVQPTAAPPTTAPANRPTTATAPNARPATPTPAPPANRPPGAQPSRPTPAAPDNRPATNRPPTTPPAKQPATPEPARPQPNHPAEPPARNDRPPAAQPNNHPEAARPESARPESARPAPKQPDQTRPNPAPRPQTTPSDERPQQRTNPPAAAKPTPPPQRQPAKPQTPEEKKREQEQKPPGE
jgi:hypothetical protein